MSRLLTGSSRDYELLDDGLEDLLDDEGPYDRGTSHIDNVSHVYNQNSRPGLLCAIRQINIPKPNFGYFNCFTCGLTGREKTILDVILCVLCIVLVHCLCIFLGYFTVLVYKPAPVIDKSYTAFKIPNHEASLNYGAFQTARKNHTSFIHAQFQNLQWAIGNRKHSTRRSSPLKLPYSSDIIGGKPGGAYDNYHGERMKRSSRDHDGYSYLQIPLQYHPQWKMQVIFLSKDGGNIFTKERLQKIHEIEKLIMKHEQFSDFCYKDTHPVVKSDPAVKSVNGCSPLNSLLTYFFPSRDGNGNVFYDGLGENMGNIDSALKLAMTSTKFYYYVDDKANSSNMRSELLRTEVLFGTPLKGMYMYCDKLCQWKSILIHQVWFLGYFYSITNNKVANDGTCIPDKYF